MKDFSSARDRMVDIHLAGRGIRDRHVLEAMRTVPREATTVSTRTTWAACVSCR